MLKSHLEDIFAPSIDLAVEKYFGVKLKDIIQRRIIRTEDKKVEIDLLAYSENSVFIVEVKSLPDRLGYVDNAMVVRGDILEIVNFKEIKSNNR